ncbi:MAG: sigma 54-interacting transcriptional regulator [Magnetococcus sp. DMHC-1]|nr:sigma 54-interacting transcriptional regulator [Magnetococcales bacterium]
MTYRPRILIVREEADLPVPVEAWLSGTNFQVKTIRGRDSTVDALTGGAFDLILVGVPAHGPDPEWLGKIQKLSLGAPLLLVGGKPVSEGITILVFDHLTDPVTSTRLLKSIQQALEFRAVSGRRHLLRQQLDAVMDGVEEVVILVDENMIVLNANEAAHRLCGFPPDTGRPITIAELTPCGSYLEEIFQRIVENRQAVRREERSCTLEQDQQSLSMQVSAAPIWGNAGRFDGVVFVVYDHTRHTGPGPLRGPRSRFHRLIGQNARMMEIYNLIEDVAGMDTTILITGESGTGKELIAEALHAESRRRGGPFIKVNCSGLPESLLEDELFGHVKGAFTGAIKNRMGRFQMADKGTIFLDEIGDIPHSMQTRLLRIIQEREFEPVGESRTVKVNVRIITATNRDLQKRILEGEFREDLYFRLKVVEIHLPPLRERSDDLPLLTQHFLQKFNTKHNKHINRLDHTVMDLFQKHAWPGNIRELENVIEHAFAFCRQNEIRMEHLPREYQKFNKTGAGDILSGEVPERLTALHREIDSSDFSPYYFGENNAGSNDLEEIVSNDILPDRITPEKMDSRSAKPVKSPDHDAAEKHLPAASSINPDEDPDEKGRILQALEAAHWKKIVAAKILGMSRSNLYRKLDQYNIK